MKIALVCSHGGHLSEILALADAYAGYETFFITYTAPHTRALPGRKYLLRNIGFNVGLMAIAAVQILFILLRERPKVILSTGAEIAVPAFYLGRLLNIRTVFVESWTRVTEPTLTGRWVYAVSDTFLVQNPELLARYGPRAQYAGSLM